MAGAREAVAALWRRARFYARRSRFERELAEEMRFHLELKARDYERDGVPPEEARFAAQRHFGNAARHREDAASVMAVGWLDALAQDVRYAARTLRRAPVLTGVAALSLAVGIGATTAIFTLADVMLLRPVPYPAHERLVVPFQTVSPAPGAPADTLPWTVAKYERLSQLVPAFEEVGFFAWQDMNLRAPARGGTRAAHRVRVEAVTASLLSALRVQPMFGRPFLGDEDAPGTVATVGLISSRLWREQLAGGPVLFTAVHLNGVPVTIIGVMPPQFAGFAGGADVWLPLRVMPRVAGGARWTERLGLQVGTVIARTRPGVSMAVVREQVAAAARGLQTLVPDRLGRPGARRGGGAVRLDDARRHPLVAPLVMLLAVAVAAVLLIVCANIAGLLLARGRARRAEFGVRIALGAGRGRLARQVLTESVAIGTLGIVPGMAIAYWGSTALAHVRPRLPQTWVLLRGTDLLAGASLAPEWRVLAFAAGLTLLTSLLFGAGPALAASRTNVSELLVAGRDRSGSAPARGRSAVVVGQVALATMLLVGAGLMVRTLRVMLRADLGFNPQGVVVLRLASEDTTAHARERRAGLFARIAALPGVEAAATHDCVPFDRECLFGMPVLGDGPHATAAERAPTVEMHVASTEYFRVMRIPLTAGRAFGRSEASGPPNAVLVSESAARRLWTDGGSPVGRHVTAGGPGAAPLEVIGVVGDTRFDAIDQPPAPAIYYSSEQLGGAPAFGTALYVRTRADPATAIADVRRAIAETDPSIAVFGETTGPDLVRDAASSARFVAVLLAGFAVMALLLATIGVYGALAYMVGQRRLEFGIRIAIGAAPRAVLALVVRQGAELTLAGLAIGVAGALGATALLTRFLYGVARGDALTYVAIVLVMGAAGLLAVLVPARHATRVDPAITLRA